VFRDIKQSPDNQILVVETKSGFTFLANEIRINFVAMFVKEIT